MFKLFGWLVIAARLTLLVWCSATVEIYWQRSASSIVLIVVGVFLGIHIGADASSACITDLHRLNKVVDDQSQELQLANALLLTKLNLNYQVKTKSG